MRVRSDRRWVIGLPPSELWDRATSLEEFTSWWPWLRHFEAEGFHEGARWRCVVKPPLPYEVRMTITLERIEAHACVQASVDGDVQGHADLTFRAHPRGTEARLVSDLAPSNGALQAFARIARPLVRFGHDWVLDRGARQFAAAAVPGSRAAPEPGAGPGWERRSDR